MTRTLLATTVLIAGCGRPTGSAGDLARSVLGLPTLSRFRAEASLEGDPTRLGVQSLHDRRGGTGQSKKGEMAFSGSLPP